MAEEVGNEGFLKFCTRREKTFEESYAAFLSDYKKQEDEANAKKEKALAQQKREEERRRKKDADRQRMKTLRPTVMVISKRKK